MKRSKFGYGKRKSFKRGYNRKNAHLPFRKSRKRRLAKVQKVRVSRGGIRL